jgi:hypothetical protein
MVEVYLNLIDSWNNFAGGIIEELLKMADLEV